MRLNLVILAELAHVVEILDRLAPRHVVDEAIHSAGYDRSILVSDRGFVSYGAEAVIVEHVARAIGDKHLGARLGELFDYSAYGAYSGFVLGAPDLKTALEHGRRALILTHPGSEIVLHSTGTHLVVGRDSRGMTLVGHRHLDEGALFIIRTVVRHFLGPDWSPDWVELPNAFGAETLTLSEMIGAPVRKGSDAASIAIRVSDLATRNPHTAEPARPITLDELASLMGIEPVQTLETTVNQVLQIRLPLGIASEEDVARHLAIGQRTLQRALRAEGTTFRRLRAGFIESNAKTLVCDSDLPIGEIARTLGYREHKSFSRAFRTWTGMSPSAFRASHGAHSHEGARRGYSEKRSS